jgi:phosphoglycolate phosphatase-like HAD superfamily hydrolase
MLFAIDIDGVCATTRGTDATGAYLREMGIPLSREWRRDQYVELKTLDALLRDEVFASWYKDQDTAAFHKLLHDGQYHPTVQEHAISVAGAVEALTRLTNEGHRLIYVTNRKSTTWDVTSSWLARYDFPDPSRLHCCGDEEGFRSKIHHARAALQEGEQVIFIDDAARYYERVIGLFVKEDFQFVPRFLRRFGLILFGGVVAPPCPYRFPAFPLAPMPNWEELDRTLALLIPFIGADCQDFFKSDFEPRLLRRTPVPRKDQVSSGVSFSRA